MARPNASLVYPYTDTPTFSNDVSIGEEKKKRKRDKQVTQDPQTTIVPLLHVIPSLSANKITSRQVLRLAEEDKSVAVDETELAKPA